MLVVACIDGYSSSSRDPDTSDMVEDVVCKRTSDYIIEQWRANFFRRRRLEIARWIKRYQSAWNPLLFVGKSLGAKVLHQVWESIGESVVYGKVGIVTVDPNWPTWKDWTPNLNNHVLTFRTPATIAINLYIPGRPRQQCGALIKGPLGTNFFNRAVNNEDHYTIQNSHELRRTLIEVTRVILPRSSPPPIPRGIA